MKIMDDLKCKDFTYKSRWTGSRLKGEEHLWVCDVYLRGKLVHTARNNTEATRWVSKTVRAANAILRAARKREENGNQTGD